MVAWHYRTNTFQVSFYFVSDVQHTDDNLTWTSTPATNDSNEDSLTSQ